MKNTFDINSNYFYMPFGPTSISPEKYGLVPVDGSDEFFYDKKRGIHWKKTLLYNTGWGRPYGYERLPELEFDNLLILALESDPHNTKLKVFEEESNKYGAVAVIMDRYVPHLLDFLSNNINNGTLFEKQLHRDNLKLFGFDAQYAGTNGGYSRESYEERLNKYPLWLEIADQIKSKVY